MGLIAGWVVVVGDEACEARDPKEVRLAGYGNCREVLCESTVGED